ncbi:hypothetical protein GQ607_005569 [Colletotrichum asianum]|uniref:Uncharacterized protein n=1 Tax=Colletotrichum asianum TaxID=702518 RepID=A0A8H3ZUL7_9PEZI|nr:hypothetical protein GQ607_005569 [Colletotrichum asianum]
MQFSFIAATLLAVLAPAWAYETHVLQPVNKDNS